MPDEFHHHHQFLQKLNCHFRWLSRSLISEIDGTLLLSVLSRVEFEVPEYWVNAQLFGSYGCQNIEVHSRIIYGGRRRVT